MNILQIKNILSHLKHWFVQTAGEYLIYKENLFNIIFHYLFIQQLKILKTQCFDFKIGLSCHKFYMLELQLIHIYSSETFYI